MIPDSELQHLSDEDYLIFRAKEDQYREPCAAKSWLITAQALFPKSKKFGIQFEVYQIEKASKNVKEAGKCLANMLRDFPHEISLCQEADSIMLALKHNQDESQASFLKQLFYTLPKDLQRGMVISAAERSQDTMTCCSLMLLLITTFPETTAHHGLKLVDTMLSAEKHCPSPLNPYRCKLVCDLLPRLLQAPGLQVRPKTLYLLLSRAIEFYVAYVTTSAKTCVDIERSIDDPWQQLFSVLRLIGWSLGWELASEFDSVSNRELILQRIQSTVEGGARLGGPKGEGSEDVQEILYTTLTVFLHALIDYAQRLYPEYQPDGSGVSSQPLTLIEAFVSTDPEEAVTVPPKRLRTSLDDDPTAPLITVSKVSTGGGAPASPHPNMNAGPLSQSLITAIKCWDLLNSYELLRAEFVRVLEGLGVKRWLTVFTTDLLIYEGRLMEAGRELRHILNHAKQVSTSHPTTLVSLSLKLASVLYTQSDLPGAAEVALDVVEQFGSLHSGNLTNNLVVPSMYGRRHLHLLALNRTQCLQYVTTMLIFALRHQILVERHFDQLCIGHLVTLLQHEWPKYESIFEEIVQIISNKGVFSYQLFYAYITTPDILEEFMHLATRKDCPIQLDIIPVTHAAKQQRTISTRGADRGSRNDFKMAMKRQMLRSDESVEKNIINFLTREGNLIRQNLT